LIVGVGSGVGRVRMRLGIVLRLPFRKTLYMDGREGVRYASDMFVWVPLGAWCVGGFGGVLWIGILGKFTRGGGGGVVMPLFRVCVCVISSEFMLGG
jgi:hypothetical protein